MQSTKSQKEKQKERIFRWILFFIPILFFLILELVLWVFHYGVDLRLFVTLEHNPKYLRINPQLGTRYFPSLKVQPETSYDILLKKKPENGFRVFVLGGSSAFGYPYGRNGAFSSFLKDRLQDYLPGREVEVINLAMCAVSSYTVRDIGLELFKYQPDVMIVYAGHNEFYGALGVGSSEFISQHRNWVNFYLKLRHYRTFLLLRNVIVKLKGSLSSDDNQFRQKRLMEHMAGEKLIPKDSAMFLRAVDNYRNNLQDLIQKAAQKGVRIYLGELVSNVRDQVPFRSDYSYQLEKSRYQKLYDEVINLIDEGKSLQALERIKQVEHLSMPPARLIFWKAKCLEKLGRLNEARQDYLLAKDLDCLRFRAPEAFNKVVRQLAQQKNVVIVPLMKVFEDSSEVGIIGNDLMTDHLHPNLKGYFLMGKSFFRAIRQDYHWSRGEVLGSEKPDSAYWKRSGVTPLDIAEANFRIRILTNSWPFKNSITTVQSLRWDRSDIVQNLAIEVIKENKTWEQAHVELAAYYIRQRKFEQALKEYESLIKLTPYNVSPYLQAAKIHIHQRRFREAIQVFAKSLNVEKSLLAYQGIGEAYLHLGMPEQGIPFLESGLKLKKNNPLTLFLLAKSHFRAGDWKKSKDYANLLYSIQPAFPGLKRLMNKLLSEKS